MIEVGYGLITCQTHPDDARGWEELYSEALELATLAEASGAESIWVSEHHFVDDGYLPALLPMMAALAAVTRTAKIGSAMVLAPFYDPLRLAEDAAVTDLISQGRVILGLSMGWLPQEFAAFGKSSRQRVRLLMDAIKICRAGWAGEPTTRTEDGTPFGYITPRPARGQIPIWIGAAAEPAVRRVGRVADGFMATNCTPDELVVAVRTLREEAEQNGRDPDAIDIAVHLQTFVTDDSDPWAAVGEHILYQAWKYGDIASRWDIAGGLRPMPPQHPDFESWVRAISLVGTADHVAARIQEYAERVGGNLHFVARSYFPGLGAQRQRENALSLAEIRRCLRHYL